MATPKRPRDSAAEHRKTAPKNSKSQAHTLTKQMEKSYREVAVAYPNPTDRQGNSDNWSSVIGRKQVPMRTRADAITFTGGGELTYAEMLMVVKTDPTLKHLSGGVQVIRKTAKVDLLL